MPLPGRRVDFESRLGHEPALHAAPRADVQDRRRFVAEVHQRLADRQRRLHVPGGPATGDEREGAWRATPGTLGHRAKAACWRRAIPNSRPTAIRATPREEPP